VKLLKRSAGLKTISAYSFIFSYLQSQIKVIANLKGGTETFASG